MAEPEKNVLGGELRACSYAPLTGYFRDGCCATHDTDGVAHLVCVQVTDLFLEFSVAKGNDLVTPRPEMRFRGLKHGDRWCLHVLRWVEAWEAGSAVSMQISGTPGRENDRPMFTPSAVCGSMSRP